jgi:hypothetical protein
MLFRVASKRFNLDWNDKFSIFFVRRDEFFHPLAPSPPNIRVQPRKQATLACVGIGTRGYAATSM